MAKRHKAFIGGSWRCGSTALNLSLIQHPSISGWREEHSNFNEVPSDWDGERWVLYKDPQASLRIGAVAASILTAAYHMLKVGSLYHDLGPDRVDRRAKTVQTKRLLTRLQRLGYAVQLTPLAA